MKFTKHDSGKSRLDLLPPTALELVGFVARFGAISKYEPHNYLTCKDHTRFVAPILRHTYKHLKGEFNDPESGLLHLAHAICSGLFALELFINEEQYRKVVEHKQFSYFAVIERKTKKRGVVLKRFRTYVSAHAWLTKEELNVDSHIVMTVQAKNKVGQKITL